MVGRRTYSGGRGSVDAEHAIPGGLLEEYSGVSTVQKPDMGVF